jgi:ABC-type glycerol-3-phosphate transport system substrate-binding protein
MKSRMMLMCAALGMLACSGAAQTDAPANIGVKSIVGIWRSQMEGLPAITLTVTFRVTLDDADHAVLMNESAYDPKAPVYVLVKTAY